MAWPRLTVKKRRRALRGPTSTSTPWPGEGCPRAARRSCTTPRCVPGPLKVALTAPLGGRPASCREQVTPSTQHPGHGPCSHGLHACYSGGGPERRFVCLFFAFVFFLKFCVFCVLPRFYVRQAAAQRERVCSSNRRRHHHCYHRRKVH